MPFKTVNNIPLSLDGSWSLIFVKKFIKCLMEITLCSEIEELKDHMIYDCVWDEVAEKMKVKKDLLKNCWYYRLHMQLFCPAPIYVNDVKIKLIEFFHENKLTDRSDINWNTIALYFDGYTVQFLQRIFQAMCRRVKEKTNFLELEDIIPYLYKKYMPKIIECSTDKVLPRLIYGNDNLSHIDENI